jgi:hypothetical protein
MGRVQRLGDVGGRRTEVAIGLGRLTLVYPISDPLASRFLQRLSNGHVVACLGVPVQTCVKTGALREGWFGFKELP